MRYKNIVKGQFISRPNRFIAYVKIDGSEEICHVKNTGRCKELLVPGATVYLEKSDNPKRKTQFDLVAVKKGDRLINMDSQAPNMVAKKFIHQMIPNLSALKAEHKFNDSRFDFYGETDTEKWLIEVKGVTLEDDGVVMFPDAPTVRGVKHVHELCSAVKMGYRCMILFIVQMEKVKYFTPNYNTHPEFGEALKEAEKEGVIIKAVDCKVTPDSMETNCPVKIRL